MVNAALRTEGIASGSVRAFNINCGVLSGVNRQSLRFCMQLVCRRFHMDGVDVNIHKIPAELRCECGRSYGADSVFLECPACGGLQHRVVAGGDIYLESIEIDDD